MQVAGRLLYSCRKISTVCRKVAVAIRLLYRLPEGCRTGCRTAGAPSCRPKAAETTGTPRETNRDNETYMYTKKRPVAATPRQKRYSSR